MCNTYIYHIGETTQLPDNCQTIGVIPFIKGLLYGSQLQGVYIDGITAGQLYVELYIFCILSLLSASCLRFDYYNNNFFRNWWWYR